MAVWVTRAGKYGEREDFALENNVVVNGSDEIPDMRQFNSWEETKAYYRQRLPDMSPSAINVGAAHMWAFSKRIEVGDIVALPLKHRSAIAFGEVTGAYDYKPENPDGAKHVLPVKWTNIDVPRAAFDQDILYSMNASQTTFQVSRNNAEERIKAVLEGKTPPLPPKGDESEDGTEMPNLEDYSRDQIRKYVGQKFKGHDFARLVEEILVAQGYKTLASPPGPDGGVDIMAGKGAMGFDVPKLCVQVKSSDSPVDVTVLRALQGVLKKFGAQQGLLVSWGGFKSSVHKEARELFFEMRLWDSDAVLRALFENYERLSEDLKAELPLKRIWMLVPEENE